MRLRCVDEKWCSKEDQKDQKKYGHGSINASKTEEKVQFIEVQV